MSQDPTTEQWEVHAERKGVLKDFSETYVVSVQTKIGTLKSIMQYVLGTDDEAVDSSAHQYSQGES